MNVLSLFDGISCGQVALERAGINVEEYHSFEIDKYAIQVSEKNYPSIIRHGSVVGADFAQFKGADLLIGGSPCQDLSIAKQGRKGLEGERSGLFWEYVRALKEIQPTYFLLENVASMTKENKRIISEAVGVEPILINSALVSAQQRKRLYWTSIPSIEQPEDKGIFLRDILESGDVNRQKSYTIHAQYGRLEYKEWYKRMFSINPGKQQHDYVFEPIRIGEIGKGGQGDRIYSVQGKSISLSANGGGRGAKTGLYKIDLPDGDYIIRKLTPLECERLQTLPEGYTEGISNTQRYKGIGNGWTVDVIAHIFKNIEQKKIEQVS